MNADEICSPRDTKGHEENTWLILSCPPVPLSAVLICVYLRSSAANIRRAVQDDLRRRFQWREVGGAEELGRAVPAGQPREAGARVARFVGATLWFGRPRAGARSSRLTGRAIAPRGVGHGLPVWPADRSARR